MNSQNSVQISNHSPVSGYGAAAVQKRLALGDLDAKIRACELMVSVMPKPRDLGDVAALAGAYAYTVSDLPEYRVVQIVQELISGRAGVKWLPAPNELGMMVREKMRFDQEWRDRPECVPAIIEDEPTKARTPAQLEAARVHVDKAMKRFHECLSGDIPEGATQRQDENHDKNGEETNNGDEAETNG